MKPKTAYTVKLAIVGDTSVGKSSIAERFARGTFTGHGEATIGAAFLCTTLDRPAHSVRYQLWDTAGQERYRALAPLYYRHAHVVVVVYDLTSRDSFLGAKRWLKEVRGCLVDRAIYAIVGNKSDLHGERLVTEAEGAALAEGPDVFREVSARSGEGITEVFASIADLVPGLDRSANSAVLVDSRNLQDGWSSCCY